MPKHNPYDQQMTAPEKRVTETSTSCRDDRPVDALYLTACVILWRATDDPKAGWELVCALASTDPGVRCLVASLLSRQSQAQLPVLYTLLVA
ncbi:MAG TPA: hypothetical protein VGJ33_18145 [Candidatus Angelobacter sp.]